SSRRVVALFGSNRNRPRLPPNSGSVTRSRCSVMRMTSIASRTLISPSDQATRPSGPTRGGKPMPRPRILPASITSSSRLARNGQADLQKRQPPENNVQDRQEDDQHEQGADRDDRDGERADLAEFEVLAAAHLVLEHAFGGPAHLFAKLARQHEGHVF